MVNDTLYRQLIAEQDRRYADFSSALNPTVARERIIGVRMPVLRSMAKKIRIDDMPPLPHRYLEEDLIHAVVLSAHKDFTVCLSEVERFLPHIDNWAVCDALRPRVFAKHTDEVVKAVKRWIRSEHEYTVRFAIGVLEAFFLDDHFTPQINDIVASVKRPEYYVKMMQAWYFATALAKQYDATLPYIEKRRLDDWTHNKAIQKASESFRVTDEHKTYLKTLKSKK